MHNPCALSVTIMIDFGKWTSAEFDALLGTAQKMPTPGGRIGFLTKQFMGLPYRSHTLIGSETEPEQFVVNLSAVDCFTLLDYLEAMRRSSSSAEFIDALKSVRYRNGEVEYRQRNHFFSDWVACQPEHIMDITAQIGGSEAITVDKVLNVKEDGGFWIPGLEPFHRRITYIPADGIDARVLAELRTGDYAGIYSGRAGLDVSHVGVIVKGPFVTYLRHASSLAERMQVVDDELVKYLPAKTGLVVYRPK